MEINKNMTAQDMFFNLGFKLVESDDDFLLYKKHTELDNTLISFDTKTKSIYSEFFARIRRLDIEPPRLMLGIEKRKKERK